LFLLLCAVVVWLLRRGLFWAVLPLLPSTAVVFFTLPLLLLTGPVTPYTRTILSNTVQPHEQAQIFAAFSAIESVSTLLSPLFGYGFSATVNIGLAGLMFEVMAGMAAVAVVIITVVRVNVSIRCNLPDQSKHALLLLEQRKSLSRAVSTAVY
jgi:MFS family permease